MAGIASLAQQVQSQGRGYDDHLVHMSGKELAGLQALAQQHGGALTKNPNTGLYEAGFLSSILPMAAGAVGSFFGGPLGGAAAGALTGALVGDKSHSMLMNAGLGGLAGWGAGSMVGSLMEAGIPAAEASTFASSLAPQAADASFASALDPSGLMNGVRATPFLDMANAGSAAAAPLAQSGATLASSAAPPITEGFGPLEQAAYTPPPPPPDVTQTPAWQYAPPGAPAQPAATPWDSMRTSQSSVVPQPPASKWDQLGNGFSKVTSSMDSAGKFLKDNKNAAIATVVGGLGMYGSGQNGVNAPAAQKGQIAPYTYNPGTRNPNWNPYGPNSQPYWLGQGYTAGTPYAAAQGGIIGMAGGGSPSEPRLLRGPGDGVSDSIPASIEGKQPAALADGEFVIPARHVSELGNGSTDAGARRLYSMMDRIEKGRKKAVGKKGIAADSKPDRYLPA